MKASKSRFDQLKLDCLQKVDLLAASRCNMFSHALILYQNALIAFWERTSRTMNHVNESFKGYQHYEFSYIKDLAEPKPEQEEGGDEGRRKARKAKRTARSRKQSSRRRKRDAASGAANVSMTRIWTSWWRSPAKAVWTSFEN